jgi:hypothetical protein
MRQLLSLAILRKHFTILDVRIDEHKLIPILQSNSFIKVFVVEGCDDVSDESLRVLA